MPHPSELEVNFKALLQRLGVDLAAITGEHVELAPNGKVTECLRIKNYRPAKQDLHETMGGTFVQPEKEYLGGTQLDLNTEWIRADIVARTVRALLLEKGGLPSRNSVGDHKRREGPDDRIITYDIMTRGDPAKTHGYDAIRQVINTIIEREEREGHPLRKAIIFSSAMQRLFPSVISKQGKRLKVPAVKFTPTADRHIQCYDFNDESILTSVKETLEPVLRARSIELTDTRTMAGPHVLSFPMPDAPEERVAIYNALTGLVRQSLSEEKASSPETGGVKRNRLPDVIEEAPQQPPAHKPDWVKRLFGGGGGPQQQGR